MVPIEHVIGLSAILFTLGVIGALTRRNLVAILMSIELMLNAVNLAFVGFNRVWAASAHSHSAMGTALDGQVFVLMVTTVAAAEVAVGLGMLIALVRNRDSLNVEEASLLRW
jgi:NADH-quinone oxidoreductase subunit K